MTPDALPLLYACAKQCTSADDATQPFYSMAKDYTPEEDMDKMSKLIRRVIDSGHTSILEAVSFSFAISGISRACSHQLVRHRVGCSYAQQSQRYVKVDDLDYVVPPSINVHHEIVYPESRSIEVYASNRLQAFNDAMDAAAKAYSALIDIGVPSEDARFVLPNACATKLVVTMNCRALLHFFEERCCNRAQWEIRALAKAMHDICVERLPVVFGGRGSGAKCISIGYCPEHNSCGMMPKRGE